MATTLIGWRPSVLPAACPSTMPAHNPFSTAQVHGLGLPAVRTVVRTEPTPAGIVPTAAALPEVERVAAAKVNNYIGTPAAGPVMGLAVAGATTSSLIATAAGDLRNQRRGADKVRGFDARGIPPRGWRPV